MSGKYDKIKKVSMIKKIIFSFILSVFFLVTLVTPFAYAQETSPWYMQDFKQWYVKVYDQSNPQEIFGERYTAAQVQWVIYGLISFFLNTDKNLGNIVCIFSGGSVDSCLQQTPIFLGYLNHEPKEEKGVFATLFPENRQLSGVNYVRSKLANFHIIPQASAQGVGFYALGPIQFIWKTIRNIMYGFFVIIIIIFAFMIMFRTKISPQTVVTVQSALPKIIITLILVTFSYAIAGFLLDLMYVVFGLLALIFLNMNFFQGASWQTIFNLLTIGPGVQGPSGIIGWFIGYSLPFIRALVSVGFNQMNLGYGAILVILSVFIIIGVLIWLFVTLIKVFIMLIKTYLSILISVIFAPFLIGFGAVLPTGGFNSWMRGIISNLLIYPMVAALLMISIMFLGATYPGVRDSIARFLDVPGVSNPFVNPDGSTTGIQYWYPPLTFGVQSGSWDPLPTLWLFASLGILALIPTVGNIIKSLMAGKGIEGAGTGMGAAFGAIGGYALGAARGGAGLLVERPLMAREAGREAAARGGGATPYVPEKRTEFFRKMGIYKR
jgi:hypothetical protein